MFHEEIRDPDCLIKTTPLDRQDRPSRIMLQGMEVHQRRTFLTVWKGLVIDNGIWDHSAGQRLRVADMYGEECLAGGLVLSG